MNRIKALGQAGQSIWLDFMQRSLVTKGELKKLIDDDGIRGLTSNPTIFQKAVESSHDYDELFTKLAPEGKTVAPGLGFHDSPRRVLLARGLSQAGQQYEGVGGGGPPAVAGARRAKRDD